MQIVSIFNMVNQANGLPLVMDFNVPAGLTEQLLIVSGTASSNADVVIIEVEVLVGATVVGTLKLLSQTGGHHRAFPTLLASLKLPADATYTLTLREKDASPTVTDFYDYFSACLLLGP